MSAHTINNLASFEQLQDPFEKMVFAARQLGIPELHIAEACENYAKARNSAGRDTIMLHFTSLVMNREMSSPSNHDVMFEQMILRARQQGVIPERKIDEACEMYVKAEDDAGRERVICNFSNGLLVNREGRGGYHNSTEEARKKIQMSAHTSHATFEKMVLGARKVGVPELYITEACDKHAKAEDSAGRETVMRDFAGMVMNQELCESSKKTMKHIGTVSRPEGFMLWTDWLDRIDAGDHQAANELIDDCFVGRMLPTSPPTGELGSRPLRERILTSAKSLPRTMAMESALLRAIAENSTHRIGRNKALRHISAALSFVPTSTCVPVLRLIGLHMWECSLFAMAGDSGDNALRGLDNAIRLMNEEYAKAVRAAVASAVASSAYSSSSSSGVSGQPVKHNGRLVGALMIRAGVRFGLGDLNGSLADNKRGHKVADGTDARGITLLYMCCHISHELGQMANSRMYFKSAQDLEKSIGPGKRPGMDANLASIKSLCESRMIQMGSHFKGGVNVKVKVPGRQCANCGETSVRSKGCAACHGAVYCTKTCQAAHWKVHKISCKAKKAAVEQARQDTPGSRSSQVHQ